jgi:hypothetical protein
MAQLRIFMESEGRMERLVSRFVPAAFAVGLALAFRGHMVSAQQTGVDRYVGGHQRAILAEFLDLVGIPNLRSDLPNIKRNAEVLKQMFDKRGMNAEI